MTRSIFQVAVFVAVMCQVSESFTGDLNKPEDCQSLQTAGIAKNGEYTIWINGILPTVVYCDMVTDGGGWTVFQRRVDGNTNFYRGWNEYKRGFGNKSSEFWLGLDAIHALTKKGDISLRVDMKTVSGSKYYARYQQFKIGSESSNYQLYVSGYSGSAGDQLNYNSGRPFSTKDRDHDTWQAGSCAVSNKGAWWYKHCTLTSLNTLYTKIQTHPYLYWYGIPVLIFTEMKIRGKKDCQTLLLEGNQIDKEYIIWINGLTPITIYCDMHTDKGGWNVIQRRVDGTVNFDRTWSEYKKGFGSKTGNFWQGLDVIHKLTQNGVSLRIDVKDLNGQSWYAKYRIFKVGTAAVNYKLEISGYTGDAGDSLSYHSGMAFSTKNADHDTWEANCATRSRGGWWFKDCFHSSLNAPYPVGSGGLYQQLTWLNDLGYGRISFSEMKFRENFTLSGIPTVAPSTTTTETTTNIVSSNIVTQLSRTNVPHTTANTFSNVQDSCRKYKILSDDSRFHGFKSTNEERCDSHLNGWYRFMYNAGNRLLDSCPALSNGTLFQCGAELQGWLNGIHPEENEREINRTVCFSRSGNCTCIYEKTIKVRNCGQYYVYLLNGVPACNQRYCGARDKRAIVSCTDNYIRVELDKKYFNASKYGSITLRNNICRAVVSNNKITLGSNPKGCGATMTETAHHIIFENDVILKAKLSGSEMISREHDQSISIRCVYKRSDFVGVSFDPVMEYKGYEEGIGSFTFKLSMYKSESYQHQHRVYPVKVNSRD